MSDEQPTESRPDEPETPSWWEQAVERLREWIDGLVEPPQALAPVPVRPRR